MHVNDLEWHLFSDGHPDPAKPFCWLANGVRYIAPACPPVDPMDTEIHWAYVKPVKQVIVVRKDLNMRTGKAIAQASHACMKDLLTVWRTGHTPNTVDDVRFLYYEGIFRKICCGVESEAELMGIHEAALAAGLTSHLIEDRGLTEFHGVLTRTCIAIGPHFDGAINPITQHLKLL